MSCYFLQWLTKLVLPTMLLAGDDIDYRSVVGKTGSNSVPKSGKSLKPTCQLMVFDFP